MINVDPKKKEEDNTKRIEDIKSDYYKQIVLYDHYTRRKNWLNQCKCKSCTICLSLLIQHK